MNWNNLFCRNGRGKRLFFRVENCSIYFSTRKYSAQTISQSFSIGMHCAPATLNALEEKCTHMALTDRERMWESGREHESLAVWNWNRFDVCVTPTWMPINKIVKNITCFRYLTLAASRQLASWPLPSYSLNWTIRFADVFVECIIMWRQFSAAA